MTPSHANSAAAESGATQVAPTPTAENPAAILASLEAQRRRTRTRDLTAAALVTSLMAVSGWIALPLGPVPITLQIFGVALAALLLPSAWALAAMSTYVVLGAIGVPVFAHGQAGPGVLMGPTGGYIIGFVIAAQLGALARETLERRGASQVAADVTAVVLVIAIVYLLGWLQLAMVTGMSAPKAFVVGVVPFLAADAIKAAVAIGVARAVRRAGVRR